MSFLISWSEENGVRIASLSGRIDSSNASELESHISQALSDQDKALLMDLTDLSFMSSAGLRVVLKQAKAYTPPKVFSIFGISDLMKEILKISGLDQIVDIYSSREDALAAILDN